MRTTLREKAVLWLNGLAIAVVAEYLLRSQVGLLSPLGVATIGLAMLALAGLSIWLLGRRG